MKRVRKAVIPAAGLGTRMLPLSRFLPKELLPFGNPPRCLLLHVLEELEEAGVSEVALVIRKEKEAIRKYLERWPRRKLKLCFLYQAAPSGLVDALWKTVDFVEKEPFLLVFPDQLLQGKTGASLQLLRKATRAGIWSSAVRVPTGELRFFPGRVTLGQKGSAAWCLFGRTILPFAIFHELKEERGGDSAAYQKAFSRVVSRMPHHVIRLAGKPRDLGTLEGCGYYLARDFLKPSAARTDKGGGGDLVHAG